MHYYSPISSINMLQNKDMLIFYVHNEDKLYILEDTLIFASF